MLPPRGGGIGFKFVGNVEIKKGPILFGTTTSPKRTVKFRINGNTSEITSNDESYFELFGDNGAITQLKVDYNAEYLKTLDVSNLNTSQITDMSQMFGACTNLNILDLSNFDTSQVTDMSRMFYLCSGLTSLDVSHFNTSKVTEMIDMFGYCAGLTSLNVSHFDTSKITNMGGMFNGCKGLTFLDLSNWDTSKVTKISGMFQDCINLETLDLSNWNLALVDNYFYNASDIFYRCASLRTIKINDKASADTLINRIQKDLKKIAKWDSTTKIITIPE